jgi:hypothetical protein
MLVFVCETKPNCYVNSRWDVLLPDKKPRFFTPPKSIPLSGPLRPAVGPDLARSPPLTRTAVCFHVCRDRSLATGRRSSIPRILLSTFMPCHTPYSWPRGLRAPHIGDSFIPTPLAVFDGFKTHKKAFLQAGGSHARSNLAASATLTVHRSRMVARRPEKTVFFRVFA